MKIRFALTMLIVLFPATRTALAESNADALWARIALANGHFSAINSAMNLYRNGGIEQIKENAADASAYTYVPEALGLLVPTSCSRDSCPGDSAYQFYLGAAFEDGRLLPQDYVQAAAWYRKAAEKGYAKALLALGEMYEEGRGVASNVVIAYVLYNLAAARNSEVGIMHRDAVIKELTSAQISEGQRLASAWKPGSPLPVRTKKSAKAKSR